MDNNPKLNNTKSKDNSINKIFDMLDLFYANKHLYKKIKSFRDKKRHSYIKN